MIAAITSEILRVIVRTSGGTGSLNNDPPRPASGYCVGVSQKPWILDGSPLPVAALVSVARAGGQVVIAETAIAAMERARAVVETAAKGDAPVYGVNTGFGALSKTRVSSDDLETLQVNLLRSHAAGVGEPLPSEVVRAMMLLLAASLCRGHSGVRPAIPQLLCDMLEAGVTPLVPSRGSVGASGDLAPLAHLGLVLIGEGRALLGDREMPGKSAMAAAGLDLLTLSCKEALAIINGTHLMAALGSLAVADIAVLSDAATLAAAMAIDAAKGTDTCLDERLHAVRGQAGQEQVAAELRSMLEGSTILPSHVEDDPRVQDPYCLRCAPQVLGAAMDAIAGASVPLIVELGAVTDNPLVFAEDGCILSGGNFHGMPLAIAMDELRIALCHIAGISERRTNWVLSGSDGYHELPPFLACSPGVESGLMIAQYTAAACCAEMRTIAMPASVSNIPTSGGVEDYNSMGPAAGLLLRRSVDLCRSVIAIELLVMADAIEHMRPLRSGSRVETAIEQIRETVPHRDSDRVVADDIAAIERMMSDTGA